MRDQGEPTPQPAQPGTKQPPVMTIVLIMAVFFAGLLVVKHLSAPSDTTGASASVEAAAKPAAEPAAPSGASLAATPNDAIADYEAAFEGGKPIYLLFHSLLRDPRIEIPQLLTRCFPATRGASRLSTPSPTIGPAGRSPPNSAFSTDHRTLRGRRATTSHLWILSSSITGRVI